MPKILSDFKDIKTVMSINEYDFIFTGRQIYKNGGRKNDHKNDLI